MYKPASEHAEQDEIESLRADNVKLYEKMRYLQSYSQVRRGESKDVETGADGACEMKYKKIYEDNMNPFVLFNRKVANLPLLLDDPQPYQSHSPKGKT